MKIHRRKLLAAIAGLAAAGRDASRAAETAPELPAASDMEARLAALKSQTAALHGVLSDNVPGLSIAAIVAGEIAWEGGFGLIARGGAQKVDSETVFEAASLSKPLLAFLVLLLCEKGSIELDRPLLEYMPYPDAELEPRSKRVTARHVLTHRTGLPNWRKEADLSFGFDPGSKFGYSGEAYFWLQRVVERVSGTPFAKLMRQEVLEPCGMKRSSFLLTPEQIDNLAAAHPSRDDTGPGLYTEIGERYLEIARKRNRPVEEWFYADVKRAAMSQGESKNPWPDGLAPNAASSLLTTAGDYARFMLCCTPGHHGSPLSAEKRALMLTPASKLNDYTSYGLGWCLEEMDGRVCLFHGGSNRGYRCVALLEKNQKAGAVMLTNSNEGDRLRWPLIHTFTGMGAAALL